MCFTTSLLLCVVAEWRASVFPPGAPLVLHQLRSGGHLEAAGLQHGPGGRVQRSQDAGAGQALLPAALLRLEGRGMGQGEVAHTSLGTESFSKFQIALNGKAYVVTP